MVKAPPGPVLYVPITVPPLPLVPDIYLTWKMAPSTGSFVTESYFHTTNALRGVFWKRTVLLSLPWMITVCVMGYFSWNPSAGSTSVMVNSPGYSRLPSSWTLISPLESVNASP